MDFDFMIPDCSYSRIIPVKKKCTDTIRLKETWKYMYLWIFFQLFTDHPCCTFTSLFQSFHITLCNLLHAYIIKNFKVIKKCCGKLEYLIYEMLWIKNKRPKLNTQADSIRAKLFNWANAFMLIYFFSLSNL